MQGGSTFYPPQAAMMQQQQQQQQKQQAQQPQVEPSQQPQTRRRPTAAIPIKPPQVRVLNLQVPDGTMAIKGHVSISVLCFHPLVGVGGAVA